MTQRPNRRLLALGLCAPLGLMPFPFDDAWAQTTPPQTTPAAPLAGATEADAPKPPALPQASAALLAAETAPQGLSLPVDWVMSGPAAQASDMIVIARADDPAGSYLSHSYARTHPAELRLPLTPGTYELRFLVQPEAGDPLILGRKPITLTPLAVHLAAPPNIGAGSRFLVNHDGPAYHADYISIAPRGSHVEEYASYNYVARGGPVSIVAPLTPGDYELRYISAGVDGEHILAAEPLVVDAVITELSTVAEAAAGSTIEVTWRGPENRRDFIGLFAPHASDEDYESYILTSAGSPLNMVLPIRPGDWELRYISTADENTALAKTPITLTPISATLDAPEAAAQRSMIEIAYTGPEHRGDYLALATPGARAEDALVYAFVSNGSPAHMRLPAQPGTYELRYVANTYEDVILTARPLRVEAVPTSLEASPSAGAGTQIEVTWAGPGAPGDMIAVASIGAPPEQALTHVMVEANPAHLRLPADPGNYELRYVAGGDTPLVLGAQKIAVLAVSAELAAPSEAAIGAPIDVAWQGPAAHGDQIVITLPEADVATAIRRVYLGDQPQITLAAPTEAGRYELRYISAGRVLARSALDVQHVAAELNLVQGGADLVQGSFAEVHWQGPGNPADRLVLAPVGAPSDSVLSHAYLRDGNPVRLRLPLEPGDYEIRYLLPGAPEAKVLTSLPLSVRAVPVSLTAEALAAAGSPLRIVWQGPGNPGDRIAIARADQAASEALSLTYLRGDGTADLTLPLLEGEFELRYIARGSSDQILARAPITLTPVSATLEAAASAPAGSKLAVSWTGPGYRGDALDVMSASGEVLLSRPIGRANPLTVTLPEAAGDYILRYRAGQGDILASRSLSVTGE